MNFEQIIYDKNDERAIIALNRPAKLNALTDEMMKELRTALLTAEDDADIRVVVIKGEGRAFSSGFDISPPPVPRGPIEWREHFRNGNATFQTIWQLSKPVIAQVHGACLGGAFDMIMACDLTICSENAFFGEREVHAGWTSMYLLLPWVVGMKTAKHILLTGDNISAQQALDLQIVNQVVLDDQLEHTVETLCSKLAKIPTRGLSLNKRILNRSYEFMGMAEAVQMSEDLAVIGIQEPSEESKKFEDIARREGMKAALAWRDAKFK